VGILIDTSVIIAAERGGQLLNVASDDEVGISSITASELLLGTHRGSAETRARRTAYVEEVLERLPVVAFGLVEARVQAAVTATMQTMGLTTATADMQIAATALARNWSLATLNRRDFERVPGLRVVGPEDAGRDPDAGDR
jgi:predicted nucleic acid-binding protein